MPYLFGASGPVTTQTTPSTASALDVSIFLIRACGYGECRILPVSIPGTDRSSVYFPWPVVLPAESTRAMRLPIMEKSDICCEIPNPAKRVRDPYSLPIGLPLRYCNLGCSQAQPSRNPTSPPISSFVSPNSILL